MAAEESGAPPPVPDQVLQTLKRSHPRLLVDNAGVERLKRLRESEPVARAIYQSVKAGAETILDQKPSVYEKPDGRRLLEISRTVLERVLKMALVYRLEDDPRYLQRTWTELEAAARFPDWNPSHFLDTAEMTAAFGIAYDWLYPTWTEVQRKVLREAIVRQGLTPGLRVYASKRGWPLNENNWNQVCNGGLSLGALAIADEEPEAAGKILRAALKSVPLAMRHYAPDGAGTEGLTYWSYGTRYNVLLLQALETALGTDFGLARIPGFAESGDYQIYISGAEREAFNFGDCGSGVAGTPQHFWFGSHFRQPRYSWFRYSELAGGRAGSVYDLIWFDGSARSYDLSALPLDKHFRQAEVASMRSAWGDPNALVLGLEAGRNSTGGHRHLDLGSFLLEAQGERWISELGVERQTYMSHKHKVGRFEFYRCRAEGHNTLVINPGAGPDQATDAFCLITGFESQPQLARARIDLQPAYRNQAAKVERAFAVVDRKAVTVEDVIEAKAPSDIWWFAHTEAKIELSEDGRTATLRKPGKKFMVRLLAPLDARFQAMPCKPLPTSPQPSIGADDSRRQKLAIHLTAAAKARLLVQFEPAR